jgi:hypothetical protein
MSNGSPPTLTSLLPWRADKLDSKPKLKLLELLLPLDHPRPSLQLHLLLNTLLVTTGTILLLRKVVFR